MTVTVLGSGTSTGVPEWRCECAVCRDARTPESRNHRTRASIHLEKDGNHLQIDCGPDFLSQIDDCRIPRLDAVLFTHNHNDHIAGVNDLVLPCRKQDMDLPVYASEETLALLRRNFDYLFTKATYQGGGVAHLLPHEVGERFELLSFEVTPLPVVHGMVDCLGFRFDDFGYVPDVKVMPRTSLELLRGVTNLIIDGLSFNPQHPTHQSIGQAIDLIQILRPQQAWLTHLSHRVDHNRFPEQCEEHGLQLPPNVALAWDGQVIAA